MTVFLILRFFLGTMKNHLEEHIHHHHHHHDHDEHKHSLEQMEPYLCIILGILCFYIMDIILEGKNHHHDHNQQNNGKEIGESSA